MHDSRTIRGGVALKAALGAVISLIFALGLMGAFSPAKAWAVIADTGVITEATADVSGFTAPQVGDTIGDTKYENTEVKLNTTYENGSTGYIIFAADDMEVSWLGPKGDMSDTEQFQEGKYMLELFLELPDSYSFATDCSADVSVKGSTPSESNIKVSGGNKSFFITLQYVIAKPVEPQAHKMTSGDGQRWEQGSTAGLTFVSDGAFADFGGVVVDDTPVAKDMYDAVAGSTKVTLKPEFLDTLSIGPHTISIFFMDDGTPAQGKFYVVEKGAAEEEEADPAKSPKTGDNGMFILGAFVASVMAAGACGIALRRREQQ